MTQPAYRTPTSDAPQRPEASLPVRRRRTGQLPGLVTLTAVAALVLSACGGQEQSGNGTDPGPSEHDGDTADQGAETGQDDSSQQEQTGEWPRSVTLGDQQIELEAPPENIVALTTETGDIALELAGPDRVAAVASGSTAHGSGNAVELAEQVEVTLPPGTTPEPEQIISQDPDLVLMTGRHDGEEDAAEVLRGSGVPALVFDSEDFATPQAVAETVLVLGEALGEEEAAEERAAELEEKVSQIEAAVAEVGESPRVLTMMSRGDQVMITGTTSTLNVLAELAGGTSAAAEQGWEATMPAGPELVLAANPEVILIEDFRGAGLEPFTEILEAEALADVPAIAEGEVHLLTSSIASGSAGLYLGHGLEAVAAALHPELEVNSGLLNSGL